MKRRSPYKLPSLEAFVEEGLDNYKKLVSALIEMGQVNPDYTEEKCLEHLKRQHAAMSKMDETQLSLYIQSQHSAQVPVLQQTLKHIDALIDASKKKEAVADDGRQLKEITAKAKK